MTYLSQPEHRRLKSKLTRAQNSGDALKIFAATREAFERFNATTWPDDWHHWNIAEGDALAQLQREHQWR